MEGFNMEDTPIPSTTKSQLWGDITDPRCETCGKVFKRRSELNRHKNIHIGPSYGCHFSQCKKQFTQKQTLVISPTSPHRRESSCMRPVRQTKWQTPAPLRSIEGAILEQSHTHAPIRVTKSVSQGRRGSRCIYEHSTNARKLMFERMERLRLQQSLTSQRQCPQLDKARVRNRILIPLVQLSNHINILTFQYFPLALLVGRYGCRSGACTSS